MVAYASRLYTIVQAGVNGKRSEWDVADDKQHIIAVEDLVKLNSLVTLDSRRFPAVQERGLAANYPNPP